MRYGPGHVRRRMDLQVLGTQYDVSGRPGRPARDGVGHARHAPGSGARGGDATEPASGHPAGALDLWLYVPPAGERFLGVRGEVRAVHEIQATDVVAPIGDDGYLDLRARGGDGGRGGVGGDGAGGRRGRRGQDATRYSWGTDGGPGGPGGDGGQGTPGARGGAGGRVVVHVDADETHLLILQTHDVAGGTGGPAGRNGRGGEGGPGGPGGRSHTWTETETYTTTQTDSNGQTRLVVRTRPVFKSNPGGSQGPSGPSGLNGTAFVGAGPAGRNGAFGIQVHDGGSVLEYERRFDLEVLGFALYSDNLDRIIEPGERVDIRRFQVRNRGGMPTPRSHPIELHVQERDWIVTRRTVPVAIREVLAEGQDRDLEASMSFDVRDTTDQELSLPGPRFRAREQATVLAYMVGAHRYFSDRTTADFEITYPIELTPLTSLASVAVGERPRIFWRVDNISQQAFGAASDLARRIVTRLRKVAGDVEGHQLRIISPAGDGRDFEEEIDRLAVTGEHIVELRLQLSPDAKPYTKAVLHASLDLGRIAAPAECRTIQRREFVVTVAETYQFTDADTLIITNNRSGREEVEHWREALSWFGLSAQVWDCGYYGFIELTRVLGSGGTLLEDFAGKNVILLDYPFDATVGDQNDGADNLEEIEASHLLAKEDFFRLLGQAGANLHVVGPNAGEVVRAFGIPTDAKIPRSVDGDGSLESPARSISEYLDPSEAFDPTEPRSTHGTSVDVDEYQEVETARWYLPFFEPKEKHLTRHGRRLQAGMTAANPEDATVVVTRFRPSELRSILGFKKVHLGTLEVRHTPGLRQGTATAVTVPAHEVKTKAHIHGDLNLAGFVLSLAFAKKLDLLNDLMRRLVTHADGAAHLDRLGELLVDAIIADVAREQAVVRRHGRKLSDAEVHQQLDRLDLLATHAFPIFSDPSTRHGRLLVRLLARIEYLAETQRTLWPWGTRRRFDEVTARLIAALKARVYDEPVFDEASAAAKAIAEHKARLAAEIEEERTIAPWLSRRSRDEATLEALERPFQRQGLDALAALARPPKELVVSEADFEAVVARDRAAQQQRQAFTDNFAKVKASLLGLDPAAAEPEENRFQVGESVKGRERRAARKQKARAKVAQRQLQIRRRQLKARLTRQGG